MWAACKVMQVPRVDLHSSTPPKVPTSCRYSGASCPVPTRGGQATTSAQDSGIPARCRRQQLLSLHSELRSSARAARQALTALRRSGASGCPTNNRREQTLPHDADRDCLAGAGRAAQLQQTMLALACWQALTPQQASAAETVPLEVLKSLLVRLICCQHCCCCCKPRALSWPRVYRIR